MAHTLGALFTIAVAHAVAVPINPNIPGSRDVATGGVVALIGNFYDFALIISGLLAFVMIVYGGIKYMLSAGNPSGQSDARDTLLQAFLGLVLLFGAYIILGTINPNLTSIKLPTFESIDISSLGSGANPLGSAGQAGSGVRTAACQAPTEGACSINSLQTQGGGCFGSGIDLAAGVCRFESLNGQLLSSGSDKCDDGSSVSFGLFQVNISANGISGLDCPAAFKDRKGYSKSHPTCTIIDRNLYNQCKAAALDPAKNIQAACAISNGGTNFSLWGPGTRAACGI